MEEGYQTIAKVAQTDANVLITGENGTGKEVIAREIHNVSHRSNEIFVPIDISALNENLIESELFGHKRGAFTPGIVKVDTAIMTVGNGNWEQSLGFIVLKSFYG